MTVALQRRAHAFRASIGVDEVESLLIRGSPLEDRRSSWTIDVSAVRHVQPGAGYRLVNALARWARGEVIVQVPDPGDFSGEWFKTFTRSGIGLAIARHADAVRMGQHDITHRFREYYAAKGSVSSTNYAVRTDIEDSSLTADIDRFGTTFLGLARYVGLDGTMLSQEQRRVLVTLASEATLNVVDHAYKDPWEYTGATLSYLSLRHYGMTSAEVGAAGLADYLRRVRAALAEENIALLGWTEVLVCDDGVGIAARQARNPDIAREPLEVERAALEQAFTAGESIKLFTHDAVTIGEPGFGYTLIADALVQLKGHAALRSGRLLAELDATEPDATGFVLRDSELGWLPGTALHIVLPLRDPQLRIPTS